MRAELFLALLLVGCGGAPRPPTLTEQLAVVERSPVGARVGWWRYLAGDRTGAAAAFAGSAEDPLAALGRARLARDRLDDRVALAEAAAAAKSDEPLVRQVAVGWAREAAANIRGGARLLGGALGGQVGEALDGARHTVRISFLPHLDLRRLRQRPPALEGGRVQALGQWWSLQTKAPKPDPDGLVLTVWPLPDGPAHLALEVAGPVTAWRDGHLVAASPDERFPARTLRFTAGGEGPLVVVWAARKRPRGWRVPTPAATGRPGPGPAVADRGPGVDEVARSLRVEAALLDGDAEEAARWLVDAPDCPAYAALRARHAGLDAALTTGAARDRAKVGWEAAAELAPALAEYALGVLLRRQGKRDEALAHLERAAALAPGASRVHRDLARAYAGSGWPGKALRALEAAALTAPEPCALLDERATLALARGDAAIGLVPAYEGCGRPVDAAARLLDLHRPEEALERLEGTPEKSRSTRWKQLRTRALLGLGRLDEARAAAESAGEVSDKLLGADLQGAPDASFTALGAVVREHWRDPLSLDLLSAFPDWSPFAGVALDTEQAIVAFEGDAPLKGPAVRVLDHSAILFTKAGKSLRWVHEVLAIRSRDGAEEYGEIGLPDDVRVLELYTRKQDGRRLHAEETPEKQSISLPDLEVGDYVVAVYLEPGDNGYLYDSGFLTPRVYHQGADLPIEWQRFEVFSPDADAPRYQRLLGAPEPAPVTLGGRAGLRFESRRVPLLPPEHAAAPAGLWLRSVRAGRGVKLSADLDYLRDRALHARRRDTAFDAWAREVAGDGAERSRVVRLARVIRSGVDDQAGISAESVAHARQSGYGNRAATLSAALEAVGIRHRLVLARPKVHVPAGPFLQVADFVYPLIELDGWWLDPSPDRAPPGYLPALFLGGDALVVWPPWASRTPIPLPEVREVEDSRTVEATLAWAEDGALVGEVTDRLTGQEAIVIGAYLARLEPELRPRLLERLLVPVVGAAKVESMEDLEAQDPDGPLVLRYRFSARPGEALDLGLFPGAPGRGLAGLPERRTPLQIELPTHLTVRLRLTSERPLEAVVRAGEIAHGDFRYRLAADVDEDELEVEARLDVPGGLVSPEAYPGFAGWALEVDAAERIKLRVR